MKSLAVGLLVVSFVILMLVAEETQPKISESRHLTECRLNVEESKRINKRSTSSSSSEQKKRKKSKSKKCEYCEGRLKRAVFETETETETHYSGAGCAAERVDRSAFNSHQQNRDEDYSNERPGGAHDEGDDEYSEERPKPKKVKKVKKPKPKTTPLQDLFAHFDG